jgi:hypothetical protein
MILDSVLSLKTDERLLNSIKLAAQRALTPEELSEQRVSFVYGSLGPRSEMTKDGVRQEILRQGGAVTR